MSEQSQIPEPPVDPAPAEDSAAPKEPVTTEFAAGAESLATDAAPAATPQTFLPPPPPDPPIPSGPPSSPQLSGPAAALNERPELAVGGAFAGGLVLALILKRLAR